MIDPIAVLCVALGEVGIDSTMEQLRRALESEGLIVTLHGRPRAETGKVQAASNAAFMRGAG